MSVKYGPKSNRWKGLHKRKKIVYYKPTKSKDHSAYHERINVQECQMHPYDIILSYYGIKQGINMFGQDGVDTVTSDLQQLHTMKMCVPLVPEEITSAPKYKALAYLMLLKKT